MNPNLYTTVTRRQLTNEEREELYRLQGERDAWVKNKMKLAFGDMPIELREEIIKEAHIRKCLHAIENIDISEFNNNNRIEELERARYNSSGMLHININDDSGYNYKYSGIISRFTLEELEDAHALATLEEELNDNNRIDN